MTRITDTLSDDTVHLAAIVSLQQWRSEGHDPNHWTEYRDRAVQWLKLSIERLEAVE